MPVRPPWTCDTCGNPIGSIEAGWVEWLTRVAGEPPQSREKDLRLVHSHVTSPRTSGSRCQHNEDEAFSNDRFIVSDLPLVSFVEADGLMLLLEKISKADSDMRDEWIELTKRLHVVDYEQARVYFDQSVASGVIERRRASGFYTQEEIKAAITYGQDLERD